MVVPVCLVSDRLRSLWLKRNFHDRVCWQMSMHYSGGGTAGSVIP